MNKGIELPQLELMSTNHDDCTTNYTTGEFTCLEVVFRFKRRLGYYLFHTYVPTCLIVIMSWISFWIKPEAVPARVTLGVTLLLTLSTQHANSQKSLPPVSYIKVKKDLLHSTAQQSKDKHTTFILQAIDVFMSGCTFFVFLSLMEYALVNIVMGDIADIEKKKSMGISNLILGTRGIPIKREKDGALDTEVGLAVCVHKRDPSFCNGLSCDGVRQIQEQDRSCPNGKEAAAVVAASKDKVCPHKHARASNSTAFEYIGKKEKAPLQSASSEGQSMPCCH